MKLLLIIFSILLTCQMGMTQTLDEPFASVTPSAMNLYMPGDKGLEANNFTHFRNSFHPQEAIAIPVTPFDLNSLMESQNRLFVIDAREKSEYQVSHLKGAKWVGYSDFSFERVWMLDRNTTIIVYCTDGERSLVISEFMKHVGFEDVRLLQGSLIAWANANYPMVDRQGIPTNKVAIKSQKQARQLKKARAIVQ